MLKQYNAIDLEGNGGFILFSASNKTEELGNDDATPIIMLSPGVPIEIAQKVAALLNTEDPLGTISEEVTRTINERLATDPRFNDIDASTGHTTEREIFGIEDI